jgi:Molybdopterin oxidoreductase Fe4S4 domain
MNGTTSKPDVSVAINERQEMKFTRRDLLVWGAGAAAGIVATPVPWKVLDDVSIWSQNWPWIPQPPRGPVEVKASFCTLCPNGCGLRVKMSSGHAVGVAGMSTNPVNRGVLCALGYGAHQLNWHPRRLKTVTHRGLISSWTEAQDAFTRACTEGPIAVIDGFPGRAASSVLQSFAEKQHGSYRALASPEVRALLPYEKWTGISASSLGYDLENTRTVVSFGAPLLDGWGIPSRFSRLWSERGAGARDADLRLIQIDASLTRTASRSWRWITVNEGSESALALGLASALIQQKLLPANYSLPLASLPDVAQQTGVPVNAILDLAHVMVEQNPVLAIARDETPAVAALNVVLGSVGTLGGIVRRTAAPSVRLTTEQVPPNVRAVLLDASVPWDFKNETDAETFRFAAWDGGPTKADWLLPSPGFLEEISDIPTAPTASMDTYTIAAGLVKPAFEVRSAAKFIRSAEPNLTPLEEVIHARCESLLQKRAGVVHTKETIPISQFSSTQKLEETLSNGAVWVDEGTARGKLECRLGEWPSLTTKSRPDDWATSWQTAVLPPLASKLFIESTLRETPNRGNE